MWNAFIITQLELLISRAGHSIPMTAFFFHFSVQRLLFAAHISVCDGKSGTAKDLSLY